METINSRRDESEALTDITLEAVYGTEGIFSPGGIIGAITLLEAMAEKYSTRDLHSLTAVGLDGPDHTIDDVADRLAIIFAFDFFKRAGKFGVRIEGGTLDKGFITTDFNSDRHRQIFGDEPVKSWIKNGERVRFVSPTILRGKENTVISEGIVKRA